MNVFCFYCSWLVESHLKCFLPPFLLLCLCVMNIWMHLWKSICMYVSMNLHIHTCTYYICIHLLYCCCFSILFCIRDVFFFFSFFALLSYTLIDAFHFATFLSLFDMLLLSLLLFLILLYSLKKNNFFVVGSCVVLSLNLYSKALELNCDYISLPRCARVAIWFKI